MFRFLIVPLFAVFLACKNSPSEERPPNIIYILADDLGYGEIGIHGQTKIKTPNIDALARSGKRFTQHYSGAPVCAPARCVLLTGKHAGHAHIKGNDEWKERGDVWNYEAAFRDSTLEGQRPLPLNTITVGTALQSAGYKTGIFGKWGLGAPGTEGVPNKQGFDYFYGYNCQRQAHNLYPGHLWENDRKILLNNELVSPRSKLDSLADPNDIESYKRFTQHDYAPALIHKKALDFIDKSRDLAFFLYYASPLPHLPLQVPKEEVETYTGSFGKEEPYIGDQSYFPNRYPRASYAAMITYLDKQVGEIVETLKKNGLYENTIIIFSSDNGPTYLGGVDFEFFKSSSPFSNGYGRTKGFVYEGGIRVPMIVAWPGHIQANSSTDHISAFYDVLPTVCDIAEVERPEETDGISFKPVLLDSLQSVHEYLYWEFPSYKGQQAVRLGKWKAIRKNIFEGNMKLEIYDLEEDILEEIDIADSHPEIVAKMEEIMAAEHETAIIEKFKFPQLGDQ